ncbi:MAG: PEGA domain-containing protein [Bradymonadia bacterium]
MNRSMICIGAMAAVMCLGSPVRGAPAECPRAFGEHIRQGNDHYRAGDHEAALKSYEAARVACAADPEPLVGISFAQHELRACDEALTAIRSYRVACERFDCGVADFVVKRMQRIEKECEIPVRITTSPAGAALQVGDEALGQSPLKKSWLPGEYTVLVTLKGHESARIELKVPFAGPPQTVDVALKPVIKQVVKQAPKQAEQPVVKVDPEKIEMPPATGGSEVGPWITMGAGVLALGAGVWFAVQASGAKSDAEALEPHETEQYDRLEGDFDNASTAMWLSLGAGAVLTAAGAAWLMWEDDSGASVSLNPGPGMTTLEVRW